MNRSCVVLAIVCVALPMVAEAATTETWYPVESPTKANLSGIGFADDGTGFAVGHNGTVLRYDGFSWKIVPGPSNHVAFEHVAVRGEEDAWLFSRNNNVVHHYIDGRWETIAFDRLFGCQGVDFLHRDLGYAVSLFGLVYKFDGAHWERIIASNLTTDRESHLRGVAVLAENDVWIGAERFLLHFDGTNWAQSPLPPEVRQGYVRRVDGTVAMTLYPVGRLDGASWTIVSPLQADYIAAAPNHDVWAVVIADGSNRLDRLVPPGLTWSTRGRALSALANGKDGLWAVGDRGLILHLEPHTLPSFSDRTFDAGAGVQAESAMAMLADMDGSGARDLVLAHPFGRNSFLRAEEGGTFRPVPLVTPSVGSLPATENMVVADIDGDGWTDMSFRPEAQVGAASVRIFRNLGGFHFWDVSAGMAPLAAQDMYNGGSIDVFDFDGDSDLDVYESRAMSKDGSFPAPNVLHRNDGFGHFTTEPLHQHDGGSARDWTSAVLAADLTNDGRTDILAVNSWSAGNTFYKQNEWGEYVEATGESGLGGDVHLGLGAIAGDIDNDGALDVLVLTTLDYGPSRLYRNDGRGHFHDITTASGLDRVFASATQAVFVDMDLDGDLDIVLGNARGRADDVIMAGRLRLLVNDGSGHFSDATVKANIEQSTTAFVADDFDNDGDIDLYLVRSGESNRLLLNEPPGHGYVKVHLESAAPNRAALGARVSVFREDGALVGFRETNWRQPIAHFGIGDLDAVIVEVRFPSGRIVRRQAVAARSTLTLSEFAAPVLWAHNAWFFLRHRWAWSEHHRDAVALFASLSFLAGLWRLSKWLGARYFVRRVPIIVLLFCVFFTVRLVAMPLEPVSPLARLVPLSSLFVLGFGLLVWDRRVTNRADARFVGPYELLSEVGRGGMGIVYRARDSSQPGRPLVALKILNPDRVREAVSRRRFFREADIGAHLRDPGIVAVLASGECRVLDHGAWQTTAYLAMEFVDGKSLASLLDSADKLPLARALEISRDAALALSSAHGAGILHRDVKPDNILLSHAGVVKLVDFGIAAVAARRSRTEAGFLVGTLAYLPPERVRGEVEDARSDVYSLGVTMYEVICGHHIFDDKILDTAAMLRAVVEETPAAPCTIRDDIPPRLNLLLLRMLAKSPDERPARAGYVADEIELVLRELRGESVPTSNHLPPVEMTSSGAPPIRSSSAVTDPFQRETVDLPHTPALHTQTAHVDDAFDRVTLTTPVNAPFPLDKPK